MIVPLALQAQGVVGPIPGGPLVDVIGSLPFDHDQPPVAGDAPVALGIERDPGPGWANPEPIDGATIGGLGSENPGRIFLVRSTADPTRESAVLQFDVEYRVGPVPFVTTARGPAGTTVVFCGPEAPTPDEGRGES